MKKTIKLLVVLALALATFGQHSSASAGDNFKFSGNFIDAGFSMDDDCVVTSVGVFANIGKNQSPHGPGSNSVYADMYIDQYNRCTGESILAIGGTSLGNGAFQIDKNSTQPL